MANYFSQLTLDESINILLNSCQPKHIHPNHPFWESTEALSLPSIPKFNFSDEENRQLRIAYLLYVLSTQGTTALTSLSSLYLSFPLGLMSINEQSIPADMADKFIASLELGTYSSAYPIGSSSHLITESHEIRNLTLMEYCSREGTPSSILIDLMSTTRSFSVKSLIDKLKVIWQDETGIIWRTSWEDRFGVTINSGANLNKILSDKAKEAIKDSGNEATSTIKVNNYTDEYDSNNLPRPTTTDNYKTDNNTGKLVIGDLVFHVPPSSLSFSTDTQSISLPSLRTSSNPVITTKSSTPRVNITLFFDGVKSVNKFLRPLYAMYKNAPFTTVQNSTISKSFLGIQFDAEGKNEISNGEYFSTPIPIVLDAVSLHTISGYPSSFQADISVSLFNSVPYVNGGLEFLCTTDAAIEQAEYHSRRTSKAFNTYYLDHTDSKTAGKATFIEQGGTMSDHEVPSIQGIYRTKYPAESWPFVKMYRSPLSEFKSYPASIADQAKWPIYESDTLDFEIQYNSTNELDILQYRFEKQLDEFNKMQNRLNLMFLVLSDPKDDGLRKKFFESSDRTTELRSKWFSNLLNIFNEAQQVTSLFEILKTEFKYAQTTLLESGNWDSLNRPKLDLNINFLDTSGIDGKEGVTSLILGFEKYVSQLDILLYATTFPELEAGEESESIKKARSLISLNNTTKEELLGLKKSVKILEELGGTIKSRFLNELSNVILSEVEESITPTTLRLVNSSPDGSTVVHHPSKNTSVFVTTVTGISLAYANNVTALPIIGYSIPTYQHMGGSNARVTVNLRTNAEDLIKHLTDIKNSSNVINQLVTSGESDLIDLSKVSIKHNFLQSIGLEDFSLSSIRTDTIAGSPGWFDITMDFLQNSNKLTDYESLRLLQQPKVSAGVWEFFCPLKNIKFPIKEKEIEQIKSDARDKLLTQFPQQYFSGHILPPPPRSSVNVLMEETSEFMVSNYVIPDDHLVDSSIIKVVPTSGEEYNAFTFTIVNKNNGDLNSHLMFVYIDTIRDYLDHMNALLQYIESINIDGTGGKTINSFQRQFESIVLKYIKMLINSLSALAKTEPDHILKNNVAELILPELLGDEDGRFTTIQGYVLNLARVKDLGTLLRRSDSLKIIDSIIENKPSGVVRSKKDNDGGPDDLTILSNFRTRLEKHYKDLDATVGTTYPDLPIPALTLGDKAINHKLFGPAFYTYIDADFSEYKLMANTISSLRHSIALQVATLQGQIVKEKYEELNESLNERFVNIVGQLEGKVPDFIADKDGNLTLDKTFTTFINYHASMLRGYEIGEELDFKAIRDIDHYFKGNSFIAAFSDEISVFGNTEDYPDNESYGSTKKLWTKVIIAGACLRYYIFMGALSSALGIKQTIVDIDLNTKKDKEGKTYTSLNFISEDGSIIKQTNLALAARKLFKPGFNENILIQGSISSTDSGTVDEDRRQESRILNTIVQIKKELESLLTQEDPNTHANILGITDIDSDVNRFELEQKIKSEYENSQSLGLGLAFPTFKLFFIEENSNGLMLFDDFYSYDAVHSIDVVSSKHAASSTAIIKLSNVTNKLTGLDIASLYKDGSSLELPSMYLRPGTSIVLRLGYGSDYRQLPIVFQGAITDVSPGSVVEITAQSWGAELNQRIAVEEKVVHSSKGGITTLGGVILDVLDKLSGLRHFGRWEQRGIGESVDVLAGPEIKRIAAYAKNPLSRWLIGMGVDFVTDSSISKSLDSLLAGTTEDNLFLNIGNSLYDNIYVNGLRTDKYAFIKFAKLDNLLYNFDWVIDNDTAWNVLNEVCLHLGDYIVTELPYNEGSNPHSHAPRNTLYIGPREGNYKCEDSLISYESFDELIKSQAETFFKGLEDVVLDEKDPSTRAAKIILETQVPAILAGMKRAIARSTYIKDISINIDGPRILDVLKSYEFLYLHKLMLETYHTNESIQRFLLDATGDRYERLWFVIAQLLSGGDANKAIEFVRKHTDNSILNKDVLNKIIDAELDSGHEQLSRTAIAGKGGRQTISGALATYKPKFDAALKSDLSLSIVPRLASQTTPTSTSNANTVEALIKSKLLALGGASGSVFKPIVEHHFSSSHSNIISNNIMAASDRMFNAVELLYPDKPGEKATNIYRSFASYELDPNYLRTYTSVQNNIDQRTYIDFQKADRAIEYENRDALPSFIQIGQQILANQMRPMYQGNLTILGNTNIRPYHIIHLYDNVNDMSGPIEVEEVLHSFSPANGLTTTIVPNLVLYSRNMGSYVDQAYIDGLATLRFNRAVWKTSTSILGNVFLGTAVQFGGNKIKSWTDKTIGAAKEAKAEAFKAKVMKDVEETAEDVAKRTKGFGVKTSKQISSIGKFLAKVPLNGLFSAYVIGKAVTTFFNVYMSQTIGMAGLISGHNPIIFVPLIYNGRPYLAGLEGVDSFNRSLSSVMLGQIEDANGAPQGKVHAILVPFLLNDPNKR